MRRSLAILVGAAMVAGCSTPPQAEFADRIAGALGGRRAIEGIHTLLIEGDGESYYLGENRSPDSDLPVFQARFRQAFDWEHDRFRKDELRLPQFLTGSASLRRVTTALDGERGFDLGPDLKAVAVDPAVTRARRSELRHHPIGLLKAVFQGGAKLGLPRTSGNVSTADVTLADGTTLQLSVDRTSSLPIAIASPASHPILGDVTAETELSAYEDVDGVKLPGRFTERLGGFVVARVHATSQVVNVDGDAPLPKAAFAAFPAEARLQAPAVLQASNTTGPSRLTTEALAPGVWRLTGNQYSSVLVERADHLTLVEAPLNDDRTSALLDAAHQVQPAKPVTELVITHHHFDHIGGVRAAIARGLTLYANAAAPASNAASPRSRASRTFADWLRVIVDAPHTRSVDALARAPRAPTIDGVASDRVLQDPVRPLALYPIEGSEYADTLLMAYLPHERLLIEADVYSPPEVGSRGEPWYPFAANLLDNIRRRHLAVDRIVPLHGPVVPLSALEEAARRVPNAAPVADLMQ